MRGNGRNKGRRAASVFLLYFSIALLIPFSHCAAAEEWCHDITFHAGKGLLLHRTETPCCEHQSVAPDRDIHPSDSHHHHYHFLSEHPLCSSREDRLPTLAMESETILFVTTTLLASLLSALETPSLSRIDRSPGLFEPGPSVNKRVSGIAPPAIP